MLIVSDKGNRGAGSTLPPIPAGMYQSVLYAIVGLGTEIPVNPAHKPAYKVRLCFEIPSLVEKDEETGEEYTRTISKKYTLSLHEKSRLRPALVSWRNKEFTEAELAGFDLSKLVGIPATLQVIQKEYNDKTYADINTILPPMERDLKGTRETFIYSPDQHDPETWAKLSEFWQESIAKTEEYKIATQGKVESEEPVQEEAPSEAEPTLF